MTFSEVEARASLSIFGRPERLRDRRCGLLFNGDPFRDFQAPAKSIYLTATVVVCLTVIPLRTDPHVHPGSVLGSTARDEAFGEPPDGSGPVRYCVPAAVRLL